MTQFLHGIELLEIDSGSRPIQTVRSAVIGLVGTAPDASPGEKATLVFGSSLLNTAIQLTSVAAGVTGNDYTVVIEAPEAPDATLTIVSALPVVTIQPASDSEGLISTTAEELVSELNSDATVSAAFTAESLDDGSGIISALPGQSFADGTVEPFPLNTPSILAGSANKAKLLGTTGSLPSSVEDIFKQAGALIIIVRVADFPKESAIANVIDGINLLTTSQTETGYTPRILIASGFSEDESVATALETVAAKLRAMTYIDSAVGSTSTDALKRRSNFGERVELTWPNVTVFDTEQKKVVTRPYSACSAGLRVRIDNTKGFWWSKSNQQIYGINGISQPVEWILGSTSCLANLMNENHVSTLIRDSGYRHWGNRTCGSDPRWVFEQTRRTADIINDSILENHMWAVDRNITKTYFEAVTDGVNAYLRELKSLGAILEGNCWYDPDLNTPSTIQKGIVYFDFDFVPPYPAEHIIFRSRINNDYLEEVFA